jgi:hypothetical protein
VRATAEASRHDDTATPMPPWITMGSGGVLEMAAREGSVARFVTVSLRLVGRAGVHVLIEARSRHAGGPGT